MKLTKQEFLDMVANHLPGAFITSVTVDAEPVVIEDIELPYRVPNKTKVSNSRTTTFEYYDGEWFEQGASTKLRLHLKADGLDIEA